MMNGIGFSRQNLEPSRLNLRRPFFQISLVATESAHVKIAAASRRLLGGALCSVHISAIESGC